MLITIGTGELRSGAISTVRLRARTTSAVRAFAGIECRGILTVRRTFSFMLNDLDHLKGIEFLETSRHSHIRQHVPLVK